MGIFINNYAPSSDVDFFEANREKGCFSFCLVVWFKDLLNKKVSTINSIYFYTICANAALFPL